jgi:hypothetical protein
MQALEDQEWREPTLAKLKPILMSI